MTILDLLNEANKTYPDGFLSNYYDEATGEEKEDDGGDGLAFFIVREIRSLCSGIAPGEHLSDETINEVIRAIENAASELTAVACQIGTVASGAPTGEEAQSS